MASYTLNISCSPYNTSDKRNIRVQIKCVATTTSTTVLDTAIFAYRRINDEYIFDHVCSTVDMVEYPTISNLTNGESFKWCRQDTVDILVRTLSIAEDFILEVKSDVKMLYTNMLAHNNLVGTTYFTIGDTTPLTVDQNSTDNLVTEFLKTSTCTFTQPNNGTLSIQNYSDTTKRLLYTPKHGIFGTDSFMYHIVDRDNNLQSVTVSVTIPENAVRSFSNILTTPVSTTVLVGYDDTTISPALSTWLDTTKEKNISGYDAVSDHNGIIVKSGTKLKYSVPTDYTGSDSFTYIVSDGTHYAVILCQLEVTHA